MGDVRMRRVSRRRFLYGAGAAIGGLALSSCSGAAALGSSEQAVRFWNLFGGGDGARLATMEDAFGKDYPNLGLNSDTFSWGPPYYTKLSMAMVGDSPPDVAVMHISKLGAYAPVDLLEPLDPEELARYDIGPEKFLPDVIDSAKYEGTIFALPMDTHPFVQYYNTDICEKAGLLDSNGDLKPLQGADAVVEAFEKAKEETGSLGLSFYPANDPAGPWRLFTSLYGQMGGKVLSLDASEVVIDDEMARRALEFMARLTLKSEVTSAATDYAGSVAEFQGGQAGFHWNGGWEVTTFEAAKMPFSITQFPDVFGGRQAQADRHAFVIPRGLSAGRKDLALKFASSMLKNSLTWAEGGHIPAYQPVATSAEYKKLDPQSNYVGAAEDAVLDPIAWFTGAGSQFQSEASAPFSQVMNGGLTPEQGVSQFRTAVEKLVNTPSPV